MTGPVNTMPLSTLLGDGDVVSELPSRPIRVRFCDLRKSLMRSYSTHRQTIVAQRTLAAHNLSPCASSFLRVHGPILGWAVALTDLCKRGPLVYGDVVCLVALDFVLRIILAGVVRISFEFCICCVDLDDRAAHVSSLRIPANVIADVELLRHNEWPPRSNAR